MIRKPKEQIIKVVACYDCLHALKQHTKNGCKECSCKLTDYDYDQRKAAIDRAMLVDQLRGYLAQANLIHVALQKIAQDLDDTKTDELRKALSQFVVRIRPKEE